MSVYLKNTFFSFKGKISRLEFNLGILVNLVVFVILPMCLNDCLSIFFPTDGPVYCGFMICFKLACFIALFYSLICLAMKRIRDLDLSEWYILPFAFILFLYPIIDLTFLVVVTLSLHTSSSLRIFFPNIYYKNQI
ncbi:DUF805 domain-containing protein [Candidatus Berkiella aquae]|uniref:DUF805 domain-containing protein n=1 Tax=Candidatus Berkiella aquae TaxID=295108 RepID=A0A0Q9YL15_9GAMM|nr:DUF805 domain-containing protein [Candidatus Berkiella aquae]